MRSTIARREANHQWVSSTSAIRGYRLASIALRTLFLDAPRVAPQIKGTTLDLAVHAREVFADNAERDKLHAAEKQHRDHQRGVTRQVDAADNFQGGEKHCEEEREERNRHANIAPDFQRQRAERGDRVERKVPQPPIVPLGVASVARLPIEGDGGLPKTHPREEPLHESRAFGQSHQHVNHAAIDQAIVAGVVRNRDVGDAIEYLIEVTRGGALEPTVTLAALAGRKDDIETLAPFRDHRDDQLGRVLEVGVDRDDGRANRKVEARAKRDVLAKVA